MTEYELMVKRAVEEALKPYLKALVDDAVKGVLRTFGDAGTAPANATGQTVLRRLYGIWLETETIASSLRVFAAYSTSTSAALTVTLAVESKSEGRSCVEVGVRSSLAGDFYVEGSHDNARWWLVDTLTVTANVDKHAGYVNAFPYIRVRTSLVADNEILIVSSR